MRENYHNCHYPEEERADDQLVLCDSSNLSGALGKQKYKCLKKQR